MKKKHAYINQSIKKREEKKLEDIDWIKIRNEYETTNISINKLAKKYNLKFHMLKNKSYREKWRNNKEKNLNEIRINAAEKIKKEKEDVLVKHFQTSTKFMELINQSVNKENEMHTFVDKIKEGDSDGNFSESVQEFTLDSINDKKMLNLVTAFDKLQKAQRQTLGIYDIKDNANFNIKEKEIEYKKWLDEQRLKLQKEEFEYKKWLEKEKLKKDDVSIEEEDDGFIEALGIAAKEVWKDVKTEEEE